MQSGETLLASINLVLLLGGLSGERNGEKRKKEKKRKQRRKLESEGHVFPVWKWSLPMMVNCPCLDLCAWTQNRRERENSSFGPKNAEIGG